MAGVAVFRLMSLDEIEWKEEVAGYLSFMKKLLGLEKERKKYLVVG